MKDERLVEQDIVYCRMYIYTVFKHGNFTVMHIIFNIFCFFDFLRSLYGLLLGEQHIVITHYYYGAYYYYFFFFK